MKLNSQTKHFDGDAVNLLWVYLVRVLLGQRENHSLSHTALTVKSKDSEERETKSDPGQFF